MIQFRSLLIVLGVALVACAAPATLSPTQSPVTPTLPPAKEHPPYPATVTAIALSSSAATCATTNAAPPDRFRADDPAKWAAATGKPKLIEFFAYW
jgi:hypothetical protein